MAELPSLQTWGTGMHPEMARDNSARRTLAAIAEMIKEAAQSGRSLLLVLAVVEVGQGIAPVVQAWVLRLLFDDIVHRGRLGSAARLALLVVCLIGVMVVTQLVAPIAQFLFGEVDRRLSVRLQTSVYGKLNDLVGIAHLENPAVANQVQLAVQRSHFAPGSLLRTVATIGRSGVTLVGFIGVLLAASPLLALAATLAALPEIWAQAGLARRRFVSAVDVVPLQRMSGYLANLLSNVVFARELQMSGLGGHLLGRFTAANASINRYQRDLQARHLGIQTIVAAVSLVLTGATLAYVITLAAAGRITVGDVALYIGALVGIQGGISAVIRALGQVGESALFFDQYRQVLELPQTVSVAVRPAAIPKLRRGIEFQDVSFAYSDGPMVLQGLNLSLEANNCTAVVGLNGAGKSTLVKLLARFYDPLDGRILWDGIDLREFNAIELRKHMSAVLQDFVHYNLSCAENIGFGDVSNVEDSARIRRAARLAGIHGLVSSWPARYETTLGHALSAGPAVELSGGQWQSIALARMLMRDSSFVILDEPTASLDPEAEYRIYQHYRQLMHARTSLLISHRFSTVQMADVIAVVKNGRVGEIGTHAELVNGGGEYSRLFDMQAASYLGAR